MSAPSEEGGEWTVVPSRSSRPLWNGDPSVQGPTMTNRYHNGPLDDHSTHPATTGRGEVKHSVHKHRSVEAVPSHQMPRLAGGKESESHVQRGSDVRVGRDGVAVSMATTNQDGSRDEDMQQKIGAPIILSRHRSGLRSSVEDRPTGQTGLSRTTDQRTGRDSGLSGSTGYHTGWKEEEGLSGQTRHDSGPTGIRTGHSRQSCMEGGETDEREAKPLQPQSEGENRRGGLLVLRKEVAKETAQQELMHFDLSSEQQWPSIAGTPSASGCGLEVWPGSGRGWSRVVKDTPPMKLVVKEATPEDCDRSDGEGGGGDFVSVVPSKKKRKKKKATAVAPPPPPQEKKSQQPLAFDIFERMQYQPTRPVLHHKSDIDSKTTPTARNILDATAPAQRRGKEREAPKRKKPSALRKVITKEKEVKKQLREKGLPIPLDLDVTKDKLEDSQHSDEEDTDHTHVTTPTTENTTPTSIQATPTTQQTTPTSMQVTPTTQQTTPRIHNRRFREYCSHIVTEEINSVVQLLLQELVRFQDRQHQRDPIRAKSKRRYTCGLREVTKHLQLGKIKCVVVAPNLDHIQSSGGINEQVTNIVSVCRERGLPVVYALSRRRLATVLKKTFKIGCVGIFSYDGAEAHYKKLMKLVEEATVQYNQNLSPQGAGGPEVEKQVPPQVPHSGSDGSESDSSSSHTMDRMEGPTLDPEDGNETSPDVMDTPWKIFFPPANHTAGASNGTHQTGASPNTDPRPGPTEVAPAPPWMGFTWNINAPEFQPSLPPSSHHLPHSGPQLA